MRCAICGAELEVGSMHGIPVCIACFNEFVPMPRKEME
jgi:hypothetical protein